MRDLQDTVHALAAVRDQHRQALLRIASLIDCPTPGGWGDDFWPAIASVDQYAPLRPYASALQSSMARITYLLMGSPVTADALMAADEAARKASEEARSRVYEAALRAGLEEAERAALDGSAQ